VEHQIPWRVSLLGRGNLLIAVAIPVNACSNVLAAMGVFSVERAGDSILFTMLLGALLAYLSWTSGRGILQARPWAFQRTCTAGGITFGYTIAGILEMAMSGRDRTLLILFRHRSEDWWDWSFSLFQNSALREIPLMAWWVIGVGTVLRHRLPGAPARLWDRASQGLGLVFCYTWIGGTARSLQMCLDTGLSSQR
jgi:hypothetical protein